MIEQLFVEIFGIEYSDPNKAKIIAGGFFALLGFTLNYLIKIKKAVNKENPFSCKYLIKRNWIDVIITLLLLFLAMRFTQEFIGVELTMWIAVLIGSGTEYLKDKYIGRASNLFKRE